MDLPVREPSGQRLPDRLGFRQGSPPHDRRRPAAHQLQAQRHRRQPTPARARTPAADGQRGALSGTGHRSFLRPARPGRDGRLALLQFAHAGLRQRHEHDHQPRGCGPVQRGTRLLRPAIFAVPRHRNARRCHPLHDQRRGPDPDHGYPLHWPADDPCQPRDPRGRVRRQSPALVRRHPHLSVQPDRQSPPAARALAGDRHQQPLRPGRHHGIQPAQHRQTRTGVGTARVGRTDPPGGQRRFPDRRWHPRGRRRLHPGPL